MTARSSFGIALAAAGLVAISAVAGACGGPALQNAPRPSPAVVAGMAAATAGALTLADPDGAAHNVTAENEYHRAPGPDPKPVKVSAPPEVLDRLDAAERTQREQRPTPPAGPAAPAENPAPSEEPAPSGPAVEPSEFFKIPPARPPLTPQLGGFRQPGSSAHQPSTGRSAR